MNIALWIAQGLLAVAFAQFGWLKIAWPLAKLAGLMKWVPVFPPLFVRGLGCLEVLGAIGLILPALTRIVPRLTVVTTICFLVLQTFAVGLHLSRGEAGVLWLNAILVGLLVFVLWGRTKRAVIRPR